MKGRCIILMIIDFDLVNIKYSQTCFKGSPKERTKSGDQLIQVHLHCILVQGTQKRWLLKAGDPLIEVTT